MGSSAKTRSGLGHGHLIDEDVDHVVRRDALSFCVEGQDQTMAEHVVGNGLNVLRRDEVTSVQPGQSAGTLIEGDRPTGAGTELQPI